MILSTVGKKLTPCVTRIRVWNYLNTSLKAYSVYQSIKQHFSYFNTQIKLYVERIRGEVWVHKTSLMSPLFYCSTCIKLGRWVVIYIFVKGIYLVLLNDICRLDFRTVPTVMFFFSFCTKDKSKDKYFNHNLHHCHLSIDVKRNPWHTWL
jgi:hypothetical protein